MTIITATIMTIATIMTTITARSAARRRAER
jgi:hypothetical protein